MYAAEAAVRCDSEPQLGRASACGAYLSLRSLSGLEGRCQCVKNLKSGSGRCSATVTGTVHLNLNVTGRVTLTRS